VSDSILVVNAGSSSIKFRLYRRAAGTLALALKGMVEGIGTAPRFGATDAAGAALAARDWPDGATLAHEHFIERLLAWLDAHAGEPLAAAGHRVVHGGLGFAAPVRIDDAVIAGLEALVPLAPLHQPHNLAGIRAIARLKPALPQVACFDTAFHRTMPEVATRFGLPRALHDKGIRRYGFHGLSYEYVARVLAERAPALAAGRVVIAHLGNGASLCALAAGRSVATTMGFTALDGLVMGTRPGLVDPGVLLHLLEAEGMTVAALRRLLYHGGGLFGMSGLSPDMRALLGSAEPAAAEAVELFVYRIARELGSLAASLGGLDALVFTAGIGENAPAIRARVGAAAAWLGVRLDAAANVAGAFRIDAPGSGVAVLVVPTDEERMIAEHTVALLGGGT
jgi:acetate kinase